MNIITKVGGSGPQPAKVLIIGEAPGKTEIEECKPFVGQSGIELTKMLNEAGLLRTECRITNVCKYRPPGNDIELWWPKKKKEIRPGAHIQYDGEWFDPRIVEGLQELQDEVRETQPNVIVPLGNLSLWATTRTTGITKWRSSLMRPVDGTGIPETIKVIPTIHPAAVLRKWDWRYLVVHDLRRVLRWRDFEGYPEIPEDFIIRPSFDTVCSTLEGLLSRVRGGECLRLAVDIETARRHLACIALAWSKTQAICIPFIGVSGDTESDYWTHDEELRIVLLLRDLLTHERCQVIGQNWQYDCQYIGKYWGFEVNLWLDIMSEHHVQFPGLPKGLDFQASLYQDLYVYWKDESKEWKRGQPIETLWRYNCKDGVATYECADVLLRAREQRGLKATSYGSPHSIQQRLSKPMSRASMRGVRVDHDCRRKLAFVLQEDIAEAHRWIEKVVGHEFNPNSPQQMHKLFYEELGQAKILDRKTRRPTLDAEALDTIGKRDILLRPICSAISHYRSLRNCLSVCLQPVDADGRFRCQYTIPGTETYRFSSLADPFGYGSNAQNITSGERAEADWPIPNLRKWLVPDPGFAIAEFDLPQADARVVAWEAEDEDLIALFADPSRHLHMENAEAIFGKRPKSKHEINYYYAKQGVHLTNYGGNPRVLASTLGITMREAEAFQVRYFAKHPKIKEWHRRIEMQLAKFRYVENVFGYRRFYFDRMEGLLKEALAWIPQSTVAVATNLAILAVEEDPQFIRDFVFLLLQTHDSSTWEWPSSATNIIVPRMISKMTIAVPYPHPLTFVPEVKLSLKSWGDVEPYAIARI